MTWTQRDCFSVLKFVHKSNAFMCCWFCFFLCFKFFLNDSFYQYNMTCKSREGEKIQGASAITVEQTGSNRIFLFCCLQPVNVWLGWYMTHVRSYFDLISSPLQIFLRNPRNGRTDGLSCSQHWHQHPEERRWGTWGSSPKRWDKKGLFMYFSTKRLELHPSLHSPILAI